MKRIVFFALVCLLLAKAAPSPAFFSKIAEVTAENGQVRIPVKDLDSGEAKFFRYKADSKTVKFFVLKAKDGKLRAALDACDVCFKENKGYKQDGDVMVCVNCGMKFPSSRIGEQKGGCNPHPIEAVVEGDQLVLNALELAQGVRYFPQ